MRNCLLHTLLQFMNSAWVSHAELILEKLATMTMETSKGWKKEKIYKIIHENHLVWRCRPFLYMRRGGNARLRAI